MNLIERAKEKVWGKWKIMELFHWDKVYIEYDSAIRSSAADSGSSTFQKFENSILDRLVENSLKTHTSVILLEIGSGTGFLLRRYGDKYLKNNNPNLKAIIGIDYSEEMNVFAKSMLKNVSLTRYLDKNIFIWEFDAVEFTKDAFKEKLRELKLSLDDAVLIVFCAFNTLGNVTDTEDNKRRGRILKNIEEMIGDNGIFFLSVFNREILNEELEKGGYYRYHTLRDVITRHDEYPLDSDLNRGDVWTKKNGEHFYFSHWFTNKEIENILKHSGFDNFSIICGKDTSLNKFKEEFNISLGDVPRRGIIAIAPKQKWIENIVE